MLNQRGSNQPSSLFSRTFLAGTTGCFLGAGVHFGVGFLENLIQYGEVDYTSAFWMTVFFVAASAALELSSSISENNNPDKSSVFTVGSMK